MSSPPCQMLMGDAFPVQHSRARGTAVCHGQAGRDVLGSGCMAAGSEREGWPARPGQGTTVPGCIAAYSRRAPAARKSLHRCWCHSPAAQRPPKSTGGKVLTSRREMHRGMGNIHWGNSLFGRRMSLAADLPHLCPWQERKKLSPGAPPWSGAWWHIPPHAYLVYSKWSYKSVE